MAELSYDLKRRMNLIGSFAEPISATADAAGASGTHLTSWMRHFPWVFFLVTWALTFLLQHRWDASLFWLDGGGPFSDMAYGAAEGNLRNRILYVLLGLVGTYLLFRPTMQRVQLKGWLGRLTCAYYCWGAISVLWATDPALVFRRQVAFGLIMLLMFGLAKTLNIDDVSRYCIGIPLLNLPVGIAAELSNKTFHPFANGSRFGGTVHPNLQGESLAIAIVLLGWWAWRSRGRSRHALVALIAVLLVFLAMTSSRSAMIALGVSLVGSALIILIRTMRRANQLSIFVVASLALTGSLCVGVAGYSMFSPNPLLAVQMERDDGDPSQLTGRVGVWKDLVRYAEERPVLGYGFDGFWSAQHIENISEDLNWSINQGHSAYFDNLLNLGVVGLALYVAMSISVLVICGRRFLQGEDQLGYCFAIATFILIHNGAESINVLPTFPNFGFNLILINCAFIKPKPHKQHDVHAARTTGASPHIALE